MPLKLHTIIASTRPTRVGHKVAHWFQQFADESEFDAELVDLAEVALPVYDELKHPRLQDYAHDHTRRWSASVASADAFVFVTPEYNYSVAPSLLNALDYVYNEWNYKPAAFVSYGGISGGIRGVQSAKLTMTTLKMFPIFEAVVVPMIGERIGPDGAFNATPSQEKAARDLLAELHRVAGALKPLRA